MEIIKEKTVKPLSRQRIGIISLAVLKYVFVNKSFKFADLQASITDFANSSGIKRERLSEFVRWILDSLSAEYFGEEFPVTGHYEDKYEMSYCLLEELFHRKGPHLGNEIHSRIGEILPKINLDLEDQEKITKDELWQVVDVILSNYVEVEYQRMERIKGKKKNKK